MTRSKSPTGTTLVEPVPTDAATPQTAPFRRMRWFWPLVAITAAVLAVLVAWAVFEMASVDEIVGERETVPGQEDSPVAYGSNGEVSDAFLPGRVPHRDAGSSYGTGGEIPPMFAPEPEAGAGSTYGSGGEIPDTFAPADGSS